MDPQVLFDALRRRPFQPLRLHVTDGLSYDLLHSDMALPGRRDVVIGLPGNVSRPYDRFVTLALLHIACIEDLPPAQTPSSN